jgi:hypothetical protein
VVTKVAKTHHVEEGDGEEGQRIHSGRRRSPCRRGNGHGRSRQDHGRRQHRTRHAQPPVHRYAVTRDERGLDDEQQHPCGEQRAVHVNEGREWPAAHRRKKYVRGPSARTSNN